MAIFQALGKGSLQHLHLRSKNHLGRPGVIVFAPTRLETIENENYHYEIQDTRGLTQNMRYSWSNIVSHQTRLRECATMPSEQG
jgi:hypothetical protein